MVHPLGIDPGDRHRRSLVLRELQQGPCQRTAVFERCSRGFIGGKLTDGCVPLARARQDRNEEEAVREHAGQEPAQRIAVAHVVALVRNDGSQLLLG